MSAGAKPKPPRDLRQTAVRLDPEVLDQLNAHCANHPLRPRRDSVIDLAIKQYLEREEPTQQVRKSA
jgi:predicted transcriptional regulator